MSSSRLEDLVLEILRLSRRMRQDAGRGPSAAELAGYLHLPLAQVRAALARAKELAAATPDGKSGGALVPRGLDEALTAEEELRLADLVQANRRETTKRVLASLTPRERDVLRKRFGLGMKSDGYLEEAGQQFSVTRERIRRIEAKALRKLNRGGCGHHTYTFRPLGADDLPLIHDWIRRPHVACWWSDPDEQIAQLRRDPLDRGFDAHVMLLDGRPVGYLQCYDASSGAEVTALMQPPGTKGIDLFIGEAGVIGQGHGAAFVRHFTARLLALPGVRRVIADPAVANARSIRCFEKAGFRRDPRVWRRSEPVVLMICEDQEER